MPTFRLPKYGYARRLKSQFHTTVHSSISACLRGGSAIGATILICAAIDCLARYFSGTVERSKTKQRYLEFLARYFPSYQNTESFYNFVRSGLVHGYNMEGQFLIVGSNTPWARQLHMKYDEKHRAIIINPFVLYTDLRKALNRYMVDIDSDNDIRKRFDKVWRKLPFNKQQLRLKKFKHLGKPMST